MMLFTVNVYHCTVTRAYGKGKAVFAGLDREGQLGPIIVRPLKI